MHLLFFCGIFASQTLQIWADYGHCFFNAFVCFLSNFRTPDAANMSCLQTRPIFALFFAMRLLVFWWILGSKIVRKWGSQWSNFPLSLPRTSRGSPLGASGSPNGALGPHFGVPWSLFGLHLASLGLPLAFPWPPFGLPLAYLSPRLPFLIIWLLLVP